MNHMRDVVQVNRRDGASYKGTQNTSKENQDVFKKERYDHINNTMNIDGFNMNNRGGDRDKNHNKKKKGKMNKDNNNNMDSINNNMNNHMNNNMN